MLYRIPASAKLVRGNTVCGDDDATWLLIVRENQFGADLTLEFFSGEREPNLDWEIARQSRNLCGSYSYSRKGS